MNKEFKTSPIETGYNPYRVVYPSYMSYDRNENPSLDKDPKINTTIKDNKDNDLNNAEIEKGEIVLSSDFKTLHKAIGKSHKQGGIKVSLNEGDFIFSNYKNLSVSKDEHDLLELKKGGTFIKKENTPAKVVERNVDIKHYNKLSANLEDERKDFISKNSASLMLDKYQKTLGKIAFIQEDKKDKPMPTFSAGTQPIYNTKIKEDIEKAKQYLLGGLKKFDEGGPNCPEGYVWNGVECIHSSGASVIPGMNNPYLVGNNPNPIPFANPSPYSPNMFATAYSKGPYDLTKSSGQGYTDFNRSSYFKDVVNQANLLGANLGTDLTQENIDAYHQFYKNKFPGFVTNAYTNGSILANNKDKNNPLKTWDDGYFRQDALGVSPEIKDFATEEERKTIMEKEGMIPSEDPDIFYYKNKVTPNNIPTLFRTRIIGNNNQTKSIQQTTTPPKEDSKTPLKDIKPGDINISNKGSKLSWQFTPWQQANLGYLGLKAAQVERQFPYRPQVKSQLVDLQRFNPQANLNQVNNSGKMAMYAAQISNPYLASASAQSIQGNVLDKVSQVQSQYDQMNTEVANKQNATNTDIRNRDLMANIGFDKQYYDDSQEGYRNYRNLKDVAQNTVFNYANQAAQENQSLMYNQAALGPNSPFKFNFRTGQYDLTGQNPLTVQSNNGNMENNPLFKLFMSRINDSNNADTDRGKNSVLAAKAIADFIKSNQYRKKGGYIYKK